MKSVSSLSKLLAFSLLASLTALPACTSKDDSSKKDVAKEREAKLALESVLQTKQDQLALAELQKYEAQTKIAANEMTIADLESANRAIAGEKLKIENDKAAALEELNKATAKDIARIAELTAANIEFENDKAAALEELNKATAKDIARIAELTAANSEFDQILKDKDAELTNLAEANKAKIDQLGEANRALSSSIEAKDLEIVKITSDLKESEVALTSTKSDLNKRAMELEVANKELESTTKDLNSAKDAIATKNSELVETKKSLDESNKRIAELEKNPDAPSRELESERKKSEELSKNVTALTTEKEDLNKKVVDTEASVTKLNADLATMSKDLELQRFMGMQIFLDNKSEETLYAVSDDALREYYKIDKDQECLFMLSVGQSVENARLNDSSPVPKIGKLNLLPFRTSFERLAICSKNGEIQAQKDSGMIYKAAASDSSSVRNLISARTNDPCAMVPEVVPPKTGPEPVLGGKYQYMSPFIGAINGMESIGLLTGNSALLSYIQGRSRTGVDAKDCTELLADGFASPLAHTACRVIKGELKADEKVTMGCFTEERVNNAVTLKFQK